MRAWRRSLNFEASKKFEARTQKEMLPPLVVCPKFGHNRFLRKVCVPAALLHLFGPNFIAHCRLRKRKSIRSLLFSPRRVSPVFLQDSEFFFLRPRRESWQMPASPLASPSEKFERIRESRAEISSKFGDEEHLLGICHSTCFGRLHLCANPRVRRQALLGFSRRHVLL